MFLPRNHPARSNDPVGHWTTTLSLSLSLFPEKQARVREKRERERREERGSCNHEQVQGTRHHVARINDSRPRRRYEARKHFPFFSYAPLASWRLRASRGRSGIYSRSTRSSGSLPGCWILVVTRNRHAFSRAAGRLSVTRSANLSIQIFNLSARGTLLRRREIFRSEGMTSRWDIFKLVRYQMIRISLRNDSKYSDWVAQVLTVHSLFHWDDNLC